MSHSSSAAEFEQNEIARLENVERQLVTALQQSDALMAARSLTSDEMSQLVEQTKTWTALLDTFNASANFLTGEGRPTLFNRLFPLQQQVRERRRSYLTREVSAKWGETFQRAAEDRQRIHDLLNTAWMDAFWPRCPVCHMRLADALVAVCPQGHSTV